MSRALEVDGRVQVLLVDLHLTSDKYHTNYFALRTWQLLINSIIMKQLGNPLGK